MRPSPKDLEPVRIQLPKEIAISQLEVSKQYLKTTTEQMELGTVPAPVSFALNVMMDLIDHVIDMTHKHYEPAAPDPEEVAKLNRNVAKIQQWAKG